ncbi:Sensor histidine kinase DesK [Microbacterium oxydans]|uniref:histidine kinase n=1 Tax=Microbacterium oxydans TaxID=82380 RepID=A0A0F0KCL5_9MICO|nr:histidine kinase [Microbacterium oxydans]KJL18657.1 Sensor histidine kinase DesK [Microbacterium oxydans]
MILLLTSPRSSPRLAPPARDIGYAVALLIASVVFVWLGGTSTMLLRTWPWGVVAIIQCVAVAFRVHRPAWALAIVWCGVALQLSLTQEIGPQNASVLIVLYAAGRYGNVATRWAGLASAAVGGGLAGWYLAVVLPDGMGHDRGSVLFLTVAATAMLTLAWITGFLLAVLRRAEKDRIAAALAAERATHLVAVEEERSRVARDMHDVVAHSLTVMIAQAEGARLIAETNGGASPPALMAIAEAGRTALTDVRGVLADLRAGSRENAHPSLSRLDRLIAEMRTAGLSIALRVEGTPRTLPAAVDMTAFRVIQEALTNALRHGDASASADALLRWNDQELQITVTNQTRLHAADAGRGHGLIGMSERVQLTGGTMTAERTDDRLFRVHASLPYDGGRGR